MSKYDENPSAHDFYVGLAICKLKSQFPELELRRADGNLPFFDCIVPCCAELAGYRPDAMLSDGHHNWIIEVKSWADMGSKHSKRQFEIAALHLSSRSNWKMYLFVFSAPQYVELIPLPVRILLSTEKVIIDFTQAGLGEL